MKYNHLGIPTTSNFEGEIDLPHVAFEVDDLNAALAGHKVIIQPNSPSEGLLVAFVEVNGAPVELMQYVDKPNDDS